ncbi:MAG: AraC family transcriptional regulator [Gemmatimonadales bacterium]
MPPAGSPPPFAYAERRPSAALAPWIRNYWMLEVGPGAPPVHHVPPDGSTAVVVGLHGGGHGPVLLSGPWLTPLAVPVREGDRYLGARIQPGALLPLLGADPSTVRNRAVPAGFVGGDRLAPLGRALVGTTTIDDAAERLDRWFGSFAQAAERPDPLVAAAVERLTASGGEAPIATLARELDTSERTLRRRFGAATGLSPKQFARIRRVLRAAWAVATGTQTWGRAAHEAGYADQPHLHRDIADFTGLTPGELGQRIRSTAHDQVVP